jgi:hypothetical protein
MSNSFDFEFPTIVDANETLATRVALGLCRLLADFQEIVSWKWYELIYDGTKGKWVTRLAVSGGDFPTAIPGILSSGVTIGDRRVCGDGVFIQQKDNTGRDSGRMIVRGMLTEGTTGSQEGNSYPVNGVIAVALQKAIDTEWAPIISQTTTPAMVVCHAGSKGVKIGRLVSMKCNRMKQYRGAKVVS